MSNELSHPIFANSILFCTVVSSFVALAGLLVFSLAKNVRLLFLGSLEPEPVAAQVLLPKMILGNQPSSVLCILSPASGDLISPPFSFAITRKRLNLLNCCNQTGTFRSKNSSFCDKHSGRMATLNPKSDCNIVRLLCFSLREGREGPGGAAPGRGADASWEEHRHLRVAPTQVTHAGPHLTRYQLTACDISVVRTESTMPLCSVNDLPLFVARNAEFLLLLIPSPTSALHYVKNSSLFVVHYPGRSVARKICIYQALLTSLQIEKNPSMVNSFLGRARL